MTRWNGRERNGGRDSVVNAGGSAPDTDARAACRVHHLRNPGGVGGCGGKLHGDFCVPPREAVETADELLHRVTSCCGLSCWTVWYTLRDPGVSGTAEEPPRVLVHCVSVSDAVYNKHLLSGGSFRGPLLGNSASDVLLQKCAD